MQQNVSTKLFKPFKLLKLIVDSRLHECFKFIQEIQLSMMNSSFMKRSFSGSQALSPSTALGATKHQFTPWFQLNFLNLLNFLNRKGAAVSKLCKTFHQNLQFNKSTNQQISYICSPIKKHGTICSIGPQVPPANV